MDRRYAIVGIAAGLGLVAYALFAGQSDEEQIREKLALLEEAVFVGPETGQNIVVRGASLNEKFEDLFVEDVAVSIPELSSLKSGRKDLAFLAAKASSYFETLDIEFNALAISIQGNAANVRSQGDVKAVRGGELRRDSRHVRLRFVKRDGDWLIDRLVVSAEDDDAPGLEG